MIGVGRHRRTSSKPPDQRSCSSNDARATHASRAAIARDDRASLDHRSNPRLPWPPPLLPKPIAPRATVVATGPGVRRRRSSTSRAPSPLARPSREHRRRYPRECRHRWPGLGRHRRWPLGSSPLAHPREPPPPLKPNP
jgi:hypothetical protein